jgi:hypothetical protein
MEDEAFQKIREKTAAAVCERAKLGQEARGLLTEGMTPREYLGALSGHDLPTDALRFLAFALPKREAVWWACVCVGDVLGPEPSPPSAAAMAAARAWVIDPTDDKRRATFPAAEAADLGTPAGCAAAAAYFSGGSLAPAKLPAVAPPEHVTAHLVASALLLAGVIDEPQKAGEKYAAFLRTGLEVASGQRTWPQAEPAPAAAAQREGGAVHGYARRARR